MLDGFFEWLDDWRNVTILFLSLLMISSLFMLLISAQTTKPVIVQTKNPSSNLFLQKVTWLYENENVTYSPVLCPFTNEQNVTIKLVYYFLSDPIGIFDYAFFSCNIENKTLVESNESLTLILYLTSFENSDNSTGEYYLHIYGEST